MRATAMAILLVGLPLAAEAGMIPNGGRCSEGQVAVGERSRELLEEMDSRCQSNYCYPGPTAGGATKTEWYCLNAKMNCAWPGTQGERYGTWKSYAGGTNNVKCRDPGRGRARFSD